MQWCKFADMEGSVIGYFYFINTPNYANLKGVTDPKTYLENINTGINEIKADVRNVKSEVQELRERIVVVEQSAKSLHKRVDSLEQHKEAKE